MRILKYFILALFVCSVFSCVSVSTKSPQFINEDQDTYDLWFKKNNWLMLQSEKRAFEEAKTDEEREELIEQFWRARDPDPFTLKNEFRLSYEQNLIKVHKDYPNLDDARRYIYLRFGEPDSKRRFANQTVSMINPFEIRIRVGEAEIWKYSSGRQNFQVIFAKLSPHKLQQARDYYSEEESSPLSFSSLIFEILYIGPVNYVDISGFIESFFQGGFRLKTTEETVDDLKKEILDRAEDFYKNAVPKVRKEEYLHAWEKENIWVLIHPFEINSPNEAGISVWLLLGKDTLNVKKKQHLSNLSLFCEIRNLSGNQIIYYQEDSIDYKLKAKKDYYYHFWGSLAPGRYKLILEIGENIGKRYKKYELDVWTFDYSEPGLKADLLIGKIVGDSDDRFRGKLGYFFFKEGGFCPIFGSQYFKDDDELNFKDDDDLIAIFNVTGFRKNNYGNPYVEFILLFVQGEIDAQGEFVPTGRVSSTLIFRLEEDGPHYLGIRKIKIGDVVEGLKLPSGMYKVGLLIRDKIAGREGVKEFARSIRIISAIADAREYR